mmetsp:Transcript_83860/g.145673  ORF Transcript_83860/g.145673 Transcript_83860/m.145673 type:complete len:200 (+) Transcript_83860:745-1344(+)
MDASSWSRMVLDEFVHLALLCLTTFCLDEASADPSDSAFHSYMWNFCFCQDAFTCRSHVRIYRCSFCANALFCNGITSSSVLVARDFAGPPTAIGFSCFLRLVVCIRRPPPIPVTGCSGASVGCVPVSIKSGRVVYIDGSNVLGYDVAPCSGAYTVAKVLPFTGVANYGWLRCTHLLWIHAACLHNGKHPVFFDCTTCG